MIKVTEIFGEDKEILAGTYEIKIEQDGKIIAGFYAKPLHECPEDASLERDLGYAYDAIKFLKIGYEAGLTKENIIFEQIVEEG